MDVEIVVQSKPDLLEIILALCSSSCFASLLHGRQKQRNQDRDDRDHNEKLDQCKPIGA